MAGEDPSLPATQQADTLVPDIRKSYKDAPILIHRQLKVAHKSAHFRDTSPTSVMGKPRNRVSFQVNPVTLPLPPPMINPVKP